MNYIKVVRKASIKQISSLIVLLFLGLSTITAQMTVTSASPYHILGKSVVELKKQPSLSEKARPLPILLVPNSNTKVTGPIAFDSIRRQYQAPKAYQFEHLAFFCRLEVRMEKASKMPVRFRLGSVDYVDQMEGKY